MPVFFFSWVEMESVAANNGVDLFSCRTGTQQVPWRDRGKEQRKNGKG